MVIFWIAVVLSVVIVGLFLREGVLEFAHLRRSSRTGSPPDDDGELAADKAIAFSIKAAFGTLASFGCIVLISLYPSTWVLLPALSLGSAVVVTLAFWVERRGRRQTPANEQADQVKSASS